MQSYKGRYLKISIDGTAAGEIRLTFDSGQLVYAYYLSPVDAVWLSRSLRRELPEDVLERCCTWPDCEAEALCQSGNFGGQLVCEDHFRITNGTANSPLCPHRCAPIPPQSSAEALDQITALMRVWSIDSVSISGRVVDVVATATAADDLGTLKKRVDLKNPRSHTTDAAAYYAPPKPGDSAQEFSERSGIPLAEQPHPYGGQPRSYAARADASMAALDDAHAELTADDTLSDARFLDECAMRAMAAFVGNVKGEPQIRADALAALLRVTAERAYDFAGAMLAERNRRRG